MDKEIKKIVSIQDIYLNAARKQGCTVSIFLLNGVNIKGTIKSYDKYCVLVENESKQQSLIYKHAISTVLPVNKDVKLMMIK